MNLSVPRSVIGLGSCFNQSIKISWPVLSRLTWNDLQHLLKASYSECLYLITSIVFKLNLWQISDMVGSLKPSLDSPDWISFWRSSDGNNTHGELMQLSFIFALLSAAPLSDFCWWELFVTNRRRFSLPWRALQWEYVRNKTHKKGILGKGSTMKNDVSGSNVTDPYKYFLWMIVPLEAIWRSLRRTSRAFKLEG